MWATVSENELAALGPWIIQHSHDTRQRLGFSQLGITSVERNLLFTVYQSRRS
jgi:hypothetical protein